MKKEKIYKFALSGFYGDHNVGDDILQIAVINGIQKNFKNTRIVIFTSNVEKNISLFKNEGINHESFDIIYSGRWGLKEPNKKNRKAYFWIIKNFITLRKCDIHLIGPGNLIKDNTNKFMATFWVLRGFLSSLLRKPFALIAIGVADVNHSYSKFLIKHILNKARFITTRDNTSLEKLRQLHVNAPQMNSFPDLTYSLIDKEKIGACEKTGEIKKIGLNFANFSRKFYSYQDIENYKKLVVEFLKRITENNEFELIFFPFSSQSHFNDNIMYEFVSSEMKKINKHIYHYSYQNLNDLKEKIATCDAFIGTRFHSVVFAIQGCVPTLSLSYDWKSKNFLTEAGLGEYSMEIEDLTLEELLKSWDILKLNYLSYYAHLKEINKIYCMSSLKHFDTLKECI